MSTIPSAFWHSRPCRQAKAVFDQRCRVTGITDLKFEETNFFHQALCTWTEQQLRKMKLTFDVYRLANQTFNGRGLESLVERLLDGGRWMELETIRRIGDLSGIRPPRDWEAEDVTMWVEDFPDVLLPALEQDCMEAGIDLNTPKIVLEDVIEIDGTYYDENTLAEKMLVHESKNCRDEMSPVMFEAMEDWLQAQEPDYRTLCRFMIENRKYYAPRLERELQENE